MCTGRHRSQTKSSAHSRGGLGTGKWPPATSSLTATPTVTESSARTQSDPRELVPSLKVIPSPDTQLYRSLPPEKFPSTAPPHSCPPPPSPISLLPQPVPKAEFRADRNLQRPVSECQDLQHTPGELPGYPHPFRSSERPLLSLLGTKVPCLVTGLLLPM